MKTVAINYVISEKITNNSVIPDPVDDEHSSKNKIPKIAAGKTVEINYIVSDPEGNELLNAYSKSNIVSRKTMAINSDISDSEEDEQGT